MQKYPLPPKGSFYLAKSKRGPKPRTAPFLLPFKVVVYPCSGKGIGSMRFKVVDAAGARIFGGDAGKLGLKTVEKAIQVLNGQNEAGQPIQL